MCGCACVFHVNSAAFVTSCIARVANYSPDPQCQKFYMCIIGAIPSNFSNFQILLFRPLCPFLINQRRENISFEIAASCSQSLNFSDIHILSFKDSKYFKKRKAYSATAYRTDEIGEGRLF